MASPSLNLYWCCLTDIVSPSLRKQHPRCPPLLDIGGACKSAGCAQNCHNTLDSYFCSCNAGYTLNANRHDYDGM